MHAKMRQLCCKDAPGGDTLFAMTSPVLHTIGHSNHGFERLLALLRAHGVRAVVDVRSRPFSRHVPHANRGFLAGTLPREGLAYRFLGRDLGGRSGPDLPPDLDLPFAERVRTRSFARGIIALLEDAAAAPTAVLCRERDPLDCHRFHLIARHLRASVEFRHILPDGRIETQSEVEARMVERLGPAPLSLFDEPAADPVEVAWRRWAERGVTSA